MIDSKTVRLVRAIADFGSIARAAVHLNRTPSAVSHQLRKAEAAVGLVFFDRNSRSLSITEAGRAIYAYGAALFEEEAQLATKLKGLRRKADANVHGYSGFETDRLNDQARSIAEFIHYDSVWEEGSVVLEVGCGVGAQTKILARQNPGCRFLAIDRSERSILAAKADRELKTLRNAEFVHLDAFGLERLGRPFDHVFVCFVLEHLNDPLQLLKLLYAYLPPGGTITVVEGDHGSAYFHPETEAAVRAVAAQVGYQRENGGNANIGRQLQPLLVRSGFTEAKVSPRAIYVDDNNPTLKENFILKTFTAMIEGMKDPIVAAGVAKERTMVEGIRDLKRTNYPGGTFSYTFFKGTAKKALE